MKVSELAKKLKVDDKVLFLKMEEIGLEVKDAGEFLESEEVKILEEKVRLEKASNVVEKRIKPTVIRRRTKKKPEPTLAPEAPEEKAVLEMEKIPEEPEPEEKPEKKGEVKKTSKVEKKDKKEGIKKEAEKKEADKGDKVVAKKKEVKGKKEPAKSKHVSTVDVKGQPETVETQRGETLDEKEERVLRRRLKTVSKEELVEIVRPKIIRKPQAREVSKQETKKKYPQPQKVEKKEAFPKEVKSDRGELKKGPEKKRRKKKKKIEAREEESARKRPVKKKEVLVKAETGVEWGKGKIPKTKKKHGSSRKVSKQVKKTYLKPTITTPKAKKRIIRIEDVINIGELAKKMGVKAGDLIKKFMELGTMVTINEVIDYDTASLVSHEFGYEVKNIAVEEDDLIKEVEDTEGNLVLRPPVVTIMGHVDHGKTTLLDAIRETNVVDDEFGGITQHIGAYEVNIDSRKIVFIDTPGHEAFTTMRARGARVTDIVVLVVAADDGVMPQTVEAINHANSAEVPIIVAINKIDKPDANTEKVKKELMDRGLVPENLGGDVIFVNVSAKKKENLKELLEMILIQSEVLELKANPEKPARGVVIEAKLDKGRGPIGTILVREGTLRVGNHFVVGLHNGRIRALINDKGENIESAGPSIPVEILGMGGVPEAGDTFTIMENEKAAREVTRHRQLKAREKDAVTPQAKTSLEDLYKQIQEEDVKELNLIIKADVQGSVEALSDNLKRLSVDEVKVVVVHGATGSITESDVMLASASDTVIIGFAVRAEQKVQELAEKENVEIKYYNVIYDCVNDIKMAMSGMLEPELVEKPLGRAEVREIFTIPKVGIVAGSYVVDGKMIRGSNVRLIRDSNVVFEGKMSTLRRFKEDAKEVASGYECGIKIENFNDIKPNDIIEAFEIEEIAQKL